MNILIDYSKTICETLRMRSAKLGFIKHDDGCTLTLPFDLPADFSTLSDSSPECFIRLRKNGDVRISYCFLKDITEDKVDEVKYTLNKIMNDCQFACLYIDDENDVCCSYDFCLLGNEEEATELFMEIFATLSEIIVISYPYIIAATEQFSLDDIFDSTN
jgi:hypothetical protein